MTISRFLKVVFALLATLAIASAVLITWAAANRRALVRLQEKRFESYRLAEQLRRSSDELTRFARTYVVTADPKFERYYHEVLAIRNGTQPRPANYSRVYWDLRVARGADSLPPGPAVPLTTLMERAAFTNEELASLARAQQTSDSLVAIEEVAMHAIRGEYRDSAGAFTRRGPPNQALAIRLMHDSTYHHHKARIMAPIDSFLAMVETRTANELAAFAEESARALRIFATVFVAFLLVVAIAYPTLRWKVVLPVRGLQAQTKEIATDIDHLAGVSTRIASGDLTQAFAVGASPIGSTRRDEIGDLSRLHDSMVTQLQTTGAAIANMTADLRSSKEAAESASKAKGTFLAHMSHEIRTPMNAILGYSQLLQRDGSLDADQRRKVTAIRTSGDHLLSLLNDTLEMSRIEAGRLTLSIESFDLRALIDSVQSMFTELTSQRGISFRMEVAPDLGRGYRTDAAKVRQVLINLLGNATKFTDRGGIVVRVNSKDIGADRGQVTMEVEDTGPGIPPEDHELIFTAFGQTEAGKLRSGTGLGLTISRSIARLLGGDLTVRSTVGKGSTFTFTFTGDRIPDASVAVSERVLELHRLDPSETRRNALVVDDVPSNRELLAESLTRAGFVTRSASTGEEALEVFRVWTPHVVFMDLHMPGMGGMAAIRHLKEMGSQATIIVATAGADKSIAPAVASAGASGLLIKPYSEGELFATVARTMHLKFVEESTEAPAAARGAAEVRDGMRAIPPDLRAELRQACEVAHASRLVQLADRVAPHSSVAAAAIREWAGAFSYRALLDALDQAG